MDDKATDSPERAQTELDNEAQSFAAAAIGRVISDRYRVDDLLAMGGMGAVYRGTHLLLKKRIAIKILHPGIDNLPELVTRFQREAIAGAHVQHPNVATATDFGTLDDGSCFLVLEYVKGRTIHQELKQGGALEPARAARIARQIASALAATHAIGIVHRDVKPRNIMILEGTEDVVKLIDFGLAKVPMATISAAADRLSRVSLGGGGALSLRNPSVERLTLEGTIFGTIAYLAPEAALGMDAVDERSDLYALGIVLYEMLAGKHPFDAIDAAELFKQQRFTRPPPLSERAPGVKVPAALEAVMMRLLDKAPDLRYPSGQAVIEALDEALREAALEATALPMISVEEAYAPRLSESVASMPHAPPILAEPAAPLSRWRMAAGGLLFFAIGVGSMLLVARAQAPEPHEVETPLPIATAPVPPAPSGAPPTIAPPASAEAPPAITASAVASAEAPPATSAAAPGDPASAAPLRIALINSARTRDWGRGGEALLALIDADPTALRRHDVAVAARDVTAALERENGAEKLFTALARGPGDEGLDVLYEIVQAKGGSHAAVRAAEILRQDAVLSRATPALRSAFRLRDASCVDKIPLFDLAAKEGDGRALIVLETQGRACFKKSRELDFAVKALKDRLIKSAAAR